jgi:hypothetical protein
MPTVAPKMFNIKDIPDSNAYLKHRKFKDIIPCNLPIEGSISSRNLVQELRSPIVLRQPLRNKKKDKPLSQEVNFAEVPETSDDHSYANEIPEFLKKVELSK